MISSASDDRLAFVIETEAKLDGIRAARAEVRGLGGDAQQMSQRAGAAAQQQAQATATAANAAGASINGMSASSKASFDRLDASQKAAVLQFLGMGTAATQAAATTVGQMKTVDTAVRQVEQTATRAATAQTAAINNVGTATANVSPKARTAANALTSIAFAAQSGAGSAQGMAIAAGTLTSSLASLTTSARLAASASGIGALVTIIAVGIGLFRTMNAEAAVTDDRFRRILGNVDDANIDKFVELARARRSAATESMAQSPTGIRGSGADSERRRREKELAEAIDAEVAAIAIQNEVRRNAANKSRDDANAAAEAEAQDRIRDRKRTNDFYFDLANAKTEAVLRSAGRIEEIQINQANSDRVRRDEEIRALKISEDEKADLLTRSAAATAAQVEAIRDNARRSRIDKETKDFEERAQKEKDLQKRREDVVRAGFEAYTRGGESLKKVLIKMALDPIITELEGIAVRQAIKAAQHAAAFDFVGAAKHAAVAGLALAGARQVARIGGGGGGGGSSAPAGGGGSSTTFEPRTRGEGAGSVHLTLITRNPYGRDQIQNTMYELQRAEMLKLPPVPLPPTSGVARVN